MDNTEKIREVETKIAEKLRPLIKNVDKKIDVYIRRPEHEIYVLWQDGLFLYKFILSKVIELKDDQFKVYYYGMNLLNSENPYFIKKVFSFKEKQISPESVYDNCHKLYDLTPLEKNAEIVNEFITWIKVENDALKEYMKKDEEVVKLKQHVPFYFIGKDHWDERQDYIRSHLYSNEFEIGYNSMFKGIHLS